MSAVTPKAAQSGHSAISLSGQEETWHKKMKWILRLTVLAKIVGARRMVLITNASPNLGWSFSREFINVLHSGSEKIKEIDVLESAGFKNTQQN
jgi:hypothetical protein